MGRTMLVLVILILLLLLVACTPGEKTKLRKEAEQYLKEKCGKEFVVYKLEYSFGNQMYYMSAYPKDDPDFRFGVGKKKRDKEFSDGYISSTYERQSQKELASLIKEIYPNVWDYETKILLGNFQKNY